MIAAVVVEQIRDLLHEGALSQRKIAARLGVSRGTVTAIALGRRQRSARRGRPDFASPTGRPVRCGGCGGLVQMPCLLCRLRAQRQAEHRRGLWPGLGD